jgi:TorA maturation chaperone TorD
VTSDDLLSRLWLHEATEDEIERAVRELGFNAPDGDLRVATLAQEYAHLFILNVFPYGSAFTDSDGELNGASAQLSARAFEEAGFAPAELKEVAATDHLGICLAFTRHVAHRSQPIHDSNAGASSRDFPPGSDIPLLLRNFQGWAPLCCLAVEREPGVHPFYSSLATATRDRILDGVTASDGIVLDGTDVIPSSDNPGTEEDEVRLSDILRFFLAPARCGVFFSRARFGSMARQLEGGIRLPFGTRYEVARNLFVAAGEENKLAQLLDILGAELAAWRVACSAWMAEYPEWRSAGEQWTARIAGADQKLAAMRVTAGV